METTVKSDVKIGNPKITVLDIDFDTRLAMTIAGMNVLIDRNGMTETRAAVAEAELNPIIPEPQPERLGNAVLAAAGDVIRTRGWTKDAFVNGQGQVCAIGALRVASGGSPNGPGDPMAVNDAANVLMGRILEETGEAFSVQHWNDSRASVDDVLRLMY